MRDATVVYPGGHVGVERVSFALQRGEFAFVVGPTGCGKSTLIKMLIREVEPASGEVLIAGRDINRLPTGRAFPTCAGASARCSRTSSCFPTAACTTTSPTRFR